MNGELSLPQVEIAVMSMDEKGQVLIGRAQDGWDKDKLTVPISRILPFELLSDAAKRTALEWAGINVEPQHALFVCESINEKIEEHRVVVFIFAKPGSHVSSPGECFWLDVRELGNYQDEMSAIAVDGFYKLSLTLKQQAAAADPRPRQA